MTTKTINELQRGDIIATERGHLEVMAVKRPDGHTQPSIQCVDKHERSFVIPYKYGNQSVAIVGNTQQESLF